MSGEKNHIMLKMQNGVPIEAVMAAQSGLLEIVHTLRQVVCLKG